MSTVREQIVSTLVDNLVAAEIGAKVYRSRVYALTRGELPAVCVEFLNDAPDINQLGVISWTLLLRATVITRADIPDQTADPIIDQIHKVMVADKRLGGLTIDIQPTDVKFELLQTDQPRAAISLAYSVQYRTSDADLSRTQ